MAIDTRTLAPDMTSDATFRAWAQAMDAAIQAVGIIPAGDTGQIDLTTATRPAVANTAAGYKMYRFSDALQATAPVFIKVEFGTGSVATTTPAIWVTVGSATNGAGTLSGQVGTRQQFSFTSSTTASPCYTSGSSSRLSLAFWVNSPAASGSKVFIVIERTRDSTGAEDDTGVYTQFSSGTSFNNHQTVLQAGPFPNQANGTPALVPGAMSLIRGANTGLLPIMPWLPAWYNPIISIMGCYLLDIAVDNQVSVQVYGVARNYRILANNGGLSNWGGIPSAGTNNSLAMLWE